MGKLFITKDLPALLFFFLFFWQNINNILFWVCQKYVQVWQKCFCKRRRWQVRVKPPSPLHISAHTMWCSISILYSLFCFKLHFAGLHGKCSNLQKIHQSHTFRIKYLHAQKKDLTSNLYPWKSENLINLRFMKYYY